MPDREKTRLKLLSVFGIVIGVFAIGINSNSNSCFGASTPIDIKTENLTKQNLKIYTIAFWDNNWNGNGNFVNYDRELKPNESSDFCFDNDGTREFWIVAKNYNNEIKYLDVINTKESKYNFKITNKYVDSEKALIAEELTFKMDKTESLEKYLIWTNIVLICFLIASIIRIKNCW